MFVKLYYRNYSRDRGPEILSSRAACWPALVQTKYSHPQRSFLNSTAFTKGTIVLIVNSSLWALALLSRLNQAMFEGHSDRSKWARGIFSTEHTKFMVIRRFLDAFAKWRTLTIIFVMSVCPSVLPSSWNNFYSPWTDFYEIWYLRIFRKSV